MQRWFRLLYLLFFLCTFSGENLSAQTENVKKYKHHTIDGFRNTAPGFKKRRTKDMFKMLIWDKVINSSADSLPGYKLERVPNDGSYLKNNTSEASITWVGHSTLLIQMDGLNILTDPLWSNRVSLIKIAGPKRVVAPGIRLEDLPKIDIVLISNNHYDHLDKKAIEFLGNKPIYLVPLGLGSFFETLGISRYEELDWWGEIKINSITITCTPAQHSSGRTLFDKNKTLWCSWFLSGKQQKIYFAGDTGYFTGFKEIAEKFGPVNIAALPIGSYKPGWYMEPTHMNPEQAVDAYFDLQSDIFVPVHFSENEF